MSERHPDSKYTDGLRDNNSQIINEIYQKYRPDTINYILKRGGSKADAKDIFQLNLLVMYFLVKSPNFVLKAPFKHFNYGISRINWLNFYKEIRNSSSTVDDNQLYAIENGKEIRDQELYIATCESLIFKLVIEILDGFKPHHKDLILDRIANLTYKEIIEELSISEGTARKRYSDQMAKLKKKLLANPRFIRIKRMMIEDSRKT